MATVPSNVQLTGGASLVSSLTSATYAIAPGNNQRLVVLIGGSIPTSGTLPTIPSCTHNGVAMTLQATSHSNSANGGNISSSTVWAFDLLLGSTTPSGVIAAAWSTNMRANMVAFTISDVVQVGSPTLITSQSLGPDSISTASTDLVIDAVVNASQNTATGYAVTVGTGQTQLSNNRASGGSGNEINLATSYANAPGGSTTSMAWTGNVSLGPRAQHVVLGYAAAASSATATASPTISLSGSAIASQGNPSSDTNVFLAPTSSATATHVNPAAIASPTLAMTATASAGTSGSQYASGAAMLAVAVSGAALSVNPTASATASLKPTATATASQANPVAGASLPLTLNASSVAQQINPQASATASLSITMNAIALVANATASAAATLSLAVTGTGRHVNPTGLVAAALAISVTCAAYAGVIVPPSISHRLTLGSRGNLSMQTRAPLTLSARK